jgi:hypothetical protein
MRYTLKTFCGTKLIECFEQRSAVSLKRLLEHPRFYRAGETGPWGEVQYNPDRFEVSDSLREKLSDDNIDNTLTFLKKLR